MTSEKFLLNELTFYKDWPKKGINFIDICPWLNNPEALLVLKDCIKKSVSAIEATKILAVESRGFIFADFIASILGAGIVLVRKQGKLPGLVIRKDYSKEYGIDSIEIQKGAISSDDSILIFDDVLATGGTAKAVVELIKTVTNKKITILTLIELNEIGGRKILEDLGVTVISILNLKFVTLL